MSFLLLFFSPVPVPVPVPAKLCPLQVPAKLPQDDPLPPLKLEKTQPLCERLKALLTHGLLSMYDPYLIPFAKEDITLIFKLGCGHDTMVAEIIKEVCRRIQEDQGQEQDLTVDVTVLKRLCFLAVMWLSSLHADQSRCERLHRVQEEELEEQAEGEEREEDKK